MSWEQMIDLKKENKYQGWRINLRWKQKQSDTKKTAQEEVNLFMNWLTLWCGFEYVLVIPYILGFYFFLFP